MSRDWRPMFDLSEDDLTIDCLVALLEEGKYIIGSGKHYIDYDCNGYAVFGYAHPDSLQGNPCMGVYDPCMGVCDTAVDAAWFFLQLEQPLETVWGVC